MPLPPTTAPATFIAEARRRRLIRLRRHACSLCSRAKSSGMLASLDIDSDNIGRTTGSTTARPSSTICDRAR
jgi:hypothetical protein